MVNYRLWNLLSLENYNVFYEDWITLHSAKCGIAWRYESSLLLRSIVSAVDNRFWLDTTPLVSRSPLSRAHCIRYDIMIRKRFAGTTAFLQGSPGMQNFNVFVVSMSKFSMQSSYRQLERPPLRSCDVTVKLLTGVEYVCLNTSALNNSEERLNTHSPGKPLANVRKVH